MKRISMCFLASFFFLSLGFGNSITILVNQKTSNAEGIFESSRLFEDGVINYFFDSGFIVSNEPVCLEKDFLRAEQIALDEAQRGFLEFLLVFHLYLNAENGNLTEAEWDLIRVETGKKIASGKSLAPEVKTKTETEKIIKQFAEQNVREVLKYVRK